MFLLLMQFGNSVHLNAVCRFLPGRMMSFKGALEQTVMT